MLRTAVGGVRASDMLLTGTGHWCVQCVIRIVQSLAEQPVVRLFRFLASSAWSLLRSAQLMFWFSNKCTLLMKLGRDYATVVKQ